MKRVIVEYKTSLSLDTEMLIGKLIEVMESLTELSYNVDFRKEGDERLFVLTPTGALED